MKGPKYFLLISLLVVLTLPNFASAMTAEELTAKIKDLEQQIVQLKAQLTQLQGETPGWCYDFTINLKIGGEGAEVEALQTALEKEDFVITAAEKLQKEFGESTASAVSGFQQKYLDEILTPWGLKYGTGFAGPTTRTKLNKLYGCEVKEAIAPSSSTPETGITPTTPVSAGQIAQIAGDYGGQSFCIRKIDGSVFCQNEKDILVAVPGLNDAANIFAGGIRSSGHSCAVKTDGSAICWGNNKFGQLGNGTISDSYIQTPTQVTNLGPGTTAAITPVSAASTCALKINGSVVCWGANGGGQLGDGTKEEKLAPTQVSGLGSGTTATIFSNGSGGICALKINGSVVCWGSSPAIGYAENTTPVKVSQITPGTIKSLTFGFKNTFVLKKDGSVAGWGLNYCGQLGNGTQEGASALTQVYGLGPGTTAAISTSNYNSCALKINGSVVCWGCNSSGEVGDGTYFGRNKPVQVLGLGLGTTVAITVGNTSCALKTDGSIVCWPGLEVIEEGQKVKKPTPIPIPGLEKITDPNALKCSDGTFYAECSITKPKYCSEGVLKDNCSICGCDTASPFCHLDEKCAKEK